MSIDHDAIQERRQAAAAPIPVTADMQDRVADTLATAFNADPVMNWFVRQDDHHDEALRGLIGNMVEQYRTTGWAIAAADCSCATLWYRHDQEAPGLGFFQQLRMFPMLMRLCTLSRLGRVIKVMDTLESNHPKEPEHFYLFMIGVHADHQGQGLGSTILAKTLETVDAEGKPAYLENSNPKNMPLYERHGFRVMKELQFGGPDGPKLWPMWREART